MLFIWLFGCIVLPIIFATLIYFQQNEYNRTCLIITGTSLCALSAIGLALSGSFMLVISPGNILHSLITWLDFALMLVILYVAIKLKHQLCVMLASVQFAGLIYLEMFVLDGHPPAAIVADPLSLMMVLVISCIGGIIAIYGIGYMREHEAHLQLTKTRQPRFFFFILLFLGAMNALVLFDSLSWIFFCWEITTLCSFMLIAHDDTAIAKTNATRALWMNMVGGLAFMAAMIMMQKNIGTLSIQELIVISGVSYKAMAAILVPVAFLCLAGFTKAAQMPFQSWLCGAMVAPTPVSALLHSSTMVKAGVYIILRLAPSFAGTMLADTVALIGTFTFATAAALACGQSNAKKILAYSTIANLGLIVACAGIGTPEAITAGLFLLVFHALSKALLFLCVGAIEQNIHSRDIEDMRGLYERMPRTAIITLIGIFTMMLPPFGALMAKWMALEAAASATAYMPILVTLIAIGSALTVFFWARFAGMVMGTNPLSVGKPIPEIQTPSIAWSLQGLTALTLLMSLLMPLIYNASLAHIARTFDIESAYGLDYALFGDSIGLYIIYPLFAVLGLVGWLAKRASDKTVNQAHALPYLSGIQVIKNNTIGFVGPLTDFIPVTQSNYYLDAWFGEETLTTSINTIAIVLIIIMLGGLL